MSVTEKGKEGKSKMIASCEEGVTMADSVDTLGVDLRTRVKNLGAKEQARRKKCQVIFSLIKKNVSFPEELDEGVSQEAAASTYGASKNVESACSRDGHHGKVKKIEEAERQQQQRARRARPRCPFPWRLLVLRWRKISLLWPLSNGQNGSGLENGQLNRKKLG